MPDIPSREDRSEITPATSSSFKIHHLTGQQTHQYQAPLWTAMAPLPGMAFRRKHDNKLTIEFVSTGSRELTGYEPSDLIENRKVSFMNIIHPSNLILVKKTISQAFKKKSPFQHEYRIITATGQHKWVWEQGWWDLDEYGNAIAMEGFISDITICKSMAKDYPHWAEGFSSATDHSIEGILVIDDLMRIVFANQVSCIILGWPGEQLIGHDFREFLTEESKQTVTDIPLRRARSEPEDDKFEVIAVDAHGFKKRMLIKPAKISSWVGKAKTIIQVLDLSDLQQGMIINGKILPRGDYISENILDVIWTVDMNLRHTYISPSVKKVMRYSPEELFHQNIKIIMTPESYVLAITTLNSILSCTALLNNEDELDKFRTLELEMIRKDGSHIWAEIKATFIRDANRLPIEILGITRDITLRKKAEDEIKSSKEFLNALINSLDDPLFVKDKNHCWIMVNDKACEFMGLHREEIEGRYDTDLFDHDRAEHFSKTDDAVTTNHQVITEEDVTFLKGKERFISVKKSPYTDPKSGKTYITGILRDITDLKETERALQKREQEFRSMVANLPGVIYQFYTRNNHDLGLYYASDRVHDLLGLDITNMNGLFGRFLSCVAPEDIDRFLASIREAARSFTRWNCEFRYIRPNGEEVYLKGSALPEQRGEEMIFNGVLLDITDLKRVEDAHRVGKAKYRFLTEKMNDIVWTADLDLSATYYSPSIEKILGFIPKEHMKHPFREIMTPESYERAVETLNREIVREKEEGADPERTATLELECYHKDGTTRWMESIVRSTRDTTGKASGLLGVSRDITDRKLAEQELNKYRYRLEELIKDRTDELMKANLLLKQEIEVRKNTESALRMREIELDDKRTSLEEMNTALRVLLKKRDEDRSDIETTIVSNLKTVVLPYVEKLMATDLKENQKTCVSLIESYIKKITSSYIKELSSEYLGLTPSEIHVASLIKEGKGSKEIAAILNISLNTVLTHRYNIRAKVGLKNSKVNLQSYLNNME